MGPLNRYLRQILFLPDQASTFSARVDRLHYLVIGTTFGVGALIFLTMIVFFIRYRRRQPRALVPKVTSTLWVEILFWGVPLTLFVIWFFIGFNQFVYADTPPPDAMDIYVTGKQWMWKFTYPTGPNSLNVLRVPAGRPIRLLLTSRDVIHSFFVPAFRLKKDAVPDRYTQLWFNATAPGVYPVYCAEYCGLKHSYMWAQIVVLEPREFDEWLSAQEKGQVRLADARGSALEGEPFAASLAEQGRRLSVEKGCMRCHTVDGEPHIGPTWLDLYLRKETLSDGSTVVADEAYLTESMMDPDEKIVKGFKPVMPSYQGKLSAPETAALVEYIKSLRSARLEDHPSTQPVFAPVTPPAAGEGP